MWYQKVVPKKFLDPLWLTYLEMNSNPRIPAILLYKYRSYL